MRETGQAVYRDPCREQKTTSGGTQYKCSYAAGYECKRRVDNPAYARWKQRKREWEEYERKTTRAQTERQRCDAENARARRCVERCVQRTCGTAGGETPPTAGTTGGGSPASTPPTGDTGPGTPTGAGPTGTNPVGVAPEQGAPGPGNSTGSMSPPEADEVVFYGEALGTVLGAVLILGGGGGGLAGFVATGADLAVDGLTAALPLLMLGLGVGVSLGVGVLAYMNGLWIHYVLSGQQGAAQYFPGVELVRAGVMQNLSYTFLAVAAVGALFGIVAGGLFLGFGTGDDSAGLPPFDPLALVTDPATAPILPLLVSVGVMGVTYPVMAVASGLTWLYGRFFQDPSLAAVEPAMPSGFRYAGLERDVE